MVSSGGSIREETASKLIFKKMYLFSLSFWLHWVLVAACGIFCCTVLASLELWCAGLLYLVVAPDRVGSVVVARGLSCPTACGIFVPQLGIEPASPALEDGFFTTGPPGKSPSSFVVGRIQFPVAV